MIGNPTYQNKFEKRYEEFIDILKNTQELLIYSEGQIDKIGYRNLSDRVIYYLYRQIVEDFNSIFLLAGNGFARNSVKILRSMYEHCVTMKFLQEFPSGIEKNTKKETNKKRDYPDDVRKFLDYYHISRRKHFKKLQESLEVKLPSEEFKYIEDNFKAVEEKFMIENCEKCHTERLNHQWSKLDIISMAKKVNLDDILTYFCYTTALSYAHPSADSILKLTEAINSKAIGYKFESPDDEQKNLKYSHMMLLIACEVLFVQFGIQDLNSLLENNSKNFLKVWQ